MDLISLIPKLLANLILLILILTRITFLFSTFVLFRRGFVNSRIIISLSTLMSFYVILLTNSTAPSYELFSSQMIFDMFYQAFIGFLFGFILNVLFEIFTATGQIFSTQLGFSMVTLIDPRFGSITPITMLYNYVAIMVFLMLNGHLTMIKYMIDSFTSFPIGSINYPLNHIHEIIYFTKNIFSSSILLSITLIITMLLTNLTIAVMSRFAPQFNIFTVGINITMIFGLIILYMTFNSFVENSEGIINQSFYFLQQMTTR